MPGLLHPLALAAFVAGCVTVIHAQFLKRRRRSQQQLAIMKELRALFSAPLPVLFEFQAAVAEHMEKGLAGLPGGMMMLPSFVDVLPAGNERGEYYAIDLGGTNLRVLWILLGEQPGAVDDRDVREWPIPKDCFDTDNGTLMPWIADKTLQVMADHGVHVPPANGTQTTAEGAPDLAPPTVGFCFSFACKQKALNHGELLLWTKNFRGRGLIGQDVVAALAQAFAARGVSVQIPALLNDTVATLLARRYVDPSTVASVILGTGTNCAYIESSARIGTLPKQQRFGSRMIVNTEWSEVAAEALPRCQEDIWVDCASANPGRGLFEKLVSGLYLGEIARRLLLRCAEQGGLFSACASKSRRIRDALLRTDALSSAFVAAIDQDASPNLTTVAACVESAFGFSHVSLQDLRTTQEVCRLVCTRAARLCAAAIAAVLERCQTEKDAPVVIGVDGSVFAKYGAFRQRLREALEETMGEGPASRVRLELTQDGSGEGAAFLAAATVAAAAQG
jgi:hexokinase